MEEMTRRGVWHAMAYLLNGYMLIRHCYLGVSPVGSEDLDVDSLPYEVHVLASVSTWIALICFWVRSKLEGAQATASLPVAVELIYVSMTHDITSMSTSHPFHPR